MPTHKTGRDDVDRIEDRPFPKDPSRVIAISDGVFAVALTLLILDVKPPTVNQTLLASAIIGTAPRLGIFALSFAIVAYYWVSHHFSRRFGLRLTTPNNCSAAQTQLADQRYVPSSFPPPDISIQSNSSSI
jgi:hypothetical protein